MADARDQVRHDGAGALYLTYEIDDSTITYDEAERGGSAQVGLAVTFTAADKTVQLVGDGEFVLGKLISVEPDGKCNVQVKGHMTLPGGSGATLTLGSAIVGDLSTAAEGYIRSVATATAAELGVCRGFIEANDTATAVEVIL